MSISPISGGVKAPCPRCGSGQLFAGFLILLPECKACNLDYSLADAGVGPAVFVILTTGVIILALALVLDSLVRLPYWVMALILGPVIALSCLWASRVGMVLMIALQFQIQPGQFINHESSRK